MKKIDNVIVYLIGFPGTGKLTVAKEIEKKTSLRVVDNHLMNNPVFTVMPKQKNIPEKAWENVLKIYDIVFDSIVEISDKEASFILTNVLFQGDEDDKYLFEKVENMANRKKANFIPIRLVCDETEIRKRVVCDNRKQKMKITDLDIFDNMTKGQELFVPKHKNTINIDVSKLSAEQTADFLIKKIAEIAS